MLEKNNTHQCIQHIGAGMMETEQNAILEYGPCVWSCLFFMFWVFGCLFQIGFPGFYTF